MATSKTAPSAEQVPTLPSWRVRILDPEEVAEVRDELTSERDRLRLAVEHANAELTELMNEGSDGARRDPPTSVRPTSNATRNCPC